MKTYDRRCSICSKEFITIYIRQNICSFPCKQEKVRQGARHRKRGIRYGLEVFGKSCVVCGYNETIDVHHEGDKLYILCPNHHALITRGIKTIDELIYKTGIGGGGV